MASGDVYWTNQAANASGLNTVERVPAAGGTPEVLWSEITGMDPPPDDMVSNGTVVVFIAATDTFAYANGAVTGLGAGDHKNVATDWSSYYSWVQTNVPSLERFDDATGTMLKDYNRGNTGSLWLTAAGVGDS